MLKINIIDASKELGLARSLNNYRAPFVITGNYRLIDDGTDPEATIQIESNGRLIHEASNGDGPVDALARVLKKALVPLFPFLAEVKLIDYHAAIVDSSRGTATEVSVTISFTDGVNIWRVYSSSANINMASFKALIDGFEYAILSREVND